MRIILINLSKYLAIFILITVFISIGIISTVSPNIDQYSTEIKGWLNENNNYEIVVLEFVDCEMVLGCSVK